MSQPTRTTITYGAEGKVAGIEHQTVRSGTADYGDGPEPAEPKRSNDQLPAVHISTATKTAAKKFLDAFEIDIAAERQRIADHLKAEADRAAASAAEAAVRAAE